MVSSLGLDRGIIAELRSDTFTVPDGGMLEAMMSAECGDDVYGEDETVNLLQHRMAELTGKSSALFLSSGTQSNLVAMLSHCGRGEEVISGDRYHVVIDEAMGASVLGGVAIHSVRTGDDGGLLASSIRDSIKPDDIHCPVSRLISLENTVSGRVQSFENFCDVRALADEFGLLMHLDGARLFNAVVSGGRSLLEICSLFDSVSLCLSKGLGAPVGTVLCGDRDFILRGVRLRKMLGGGMRQVGFLAAAGLYAIEHNVGRLGLDHERAIRLCAGLGAYGDYFSSMPECYTNMVFLRLRGVDIGRLSNFMRGVGVMISGGESVRLVVHCGIDDAGIDYVIEKFGEYFGE